jgi:hypothetical protein
MTTPRAAWRPSRFIKMPLAAMPALYLARVTEIPEVEAVRIAVLKCQGQLRECAEALREFEPGGVDITIHSIMDLHLALRKIDVATELVKNCLKAAEKKMYGDVA